MLTLSETLLKHPVCGTERDLGADMECKICNYVFIITETKNCVFVSLE